MKFRAKGSKRGLFMKQNGKGNDNHPIAAKAKTKLRGLVFDRVSGGAGDERGPNDVHVLDLFAGEGEMHRAIWHRATTYTGCDKRLFLDSRRAFVADNRVVLRAVTLAPYNLFDFDHYGNVWEQLEIFSRRFRAPAGGTIGVVYTDGTPRAMALVSQPKALLRLAPMAKLGLRVWSLENHERIAHAAFEEIARRVAARVEKHWIVLRQAGGSPGQVYGGVILRGIS